MLVSPCAAENARLTTTTRPWKETLMSKSIIKTATMSDLSTGWVRAVLTLTLIAALILAGLFVKVRANGDDVQPEAAGDLDPTFGNGGKVATDFSVPTTANALAIQGDGKLIV